MTTDRFSEKSRNQTQSWWRRGIDPLSPVWREERAIKKLVFLGDRRDCLNLSKEGGTVKGDDGVGPCRAESR